jgi:hypothetical protein
MVFVNGTLVDSLALAGNGQGEIRRKSVTLKSTDIVDLAVSPVGANGGREDGSDGSQSWLWIDTRPVAPITSITLSPPQVNMAEGKVTLKWTSEAGVRYTVWSSANLTDWTSVQSVDSTEHRNHFHG